jgi:branched-subunit amino acid ABC-type transport system permease component
LDQQLLTSAYLVLFAISSLVLISLGLAVIFGLMKVINLAHGEFIMLGAYACVFAVNAGLPLWAAFLAAAFAVGIFGIVVERLIIRHLYGRLVDTLLATWGLSLFIVGAVTTLFGPQGRGISTNFGNLALGSINLSVYNLILSAIALAMLVLTWALARYTKFGLLARGTMQSPTVAAGLGVNPGFVYMITFGYGSAMAGLAGAVLVPLTGVSPTLGLAFVAKAFITVITGGHLPLLGTTFASTIFGTIDGVLSFLWSSVVGEVGVLVVAVIVLRLLPLGITGRMRRGL